MSVKVGVRVRPFNSRQVELNCRLCVDMMGNTTKLLDLEDPKKNRDFSFDYSFWSHDQFTPDERGYFVADSPKYADQQKVFEAVGIEILDNAWAGYHCCLFAYGQTGAGKSYSMVGYGTNKGIVPISCEQIFNRIRNNEDKTKQYEVSLSMLEIYNEKVQDLLIPINKRPKEGLKIREHKTLGVYVEGISKHFMESYNAIEQKMDEGSRNRSVAATEMNANSSRAHTIISIEFRQREMVNDKKVEKLSVIYLVDLAGSEKVGKTGATGDRLKEAAGINKSLTVLGQVISALADKAMGKGKNVVVPYRDSCLTRILQNALGGNSKTLMICAISPATDNYQETLSTLRYADQAKKIQNKAVINESETDKMIRTLTEENEKLKKLMEQFAKMGLNLDDEASLSKFNEARSELNYNNQMMNNYNMTKDEKIKQERETHDDFYVKVDTTKPYLSNLNEDPFLSRKINYSINKEETRIGKKNMEPKNDIEIAAHGILPVLAVIRQVGDKYVFEPQLDEEEELLSQNNIYLNGQVIKETIELQNNDRLKFGVNSMFLVIIPGGTERPREFAGEIDWEFAQQELYISKQKEDNILKEQERLQKEAEMKKLQEKEAELAEIRAKQEENEKALKEMLEKMEYEKAELEAKRLEEEKKHVQQLKALQLEKEIQMQKKKIREEENQRKVKVKEKYYFENKLMKTMPKVIELNLIAQQFKRNISLSVKMLLFGQEEENAGEKMNIKVQVDNRQAGYRYLWDLGKFSNRYYIIKEMIEKYYETGVVPTITQNEDPFWDPPEPILIGKSFMTFKGLVYMFDNPTDLAVIGQNHQCGQLKVNLIPTDQEGKRNLSAEMDEEDDFEPEELIGKPFYFNVQIDSAKIPDNFENIFVEYSVKNPDGEKDTFKTEEVKQQTKNPAFNYIKTHKFNNITDETLNYLENTNLVFKLYGNELIKQPTSTKKSTPNPNPTISTIVANSNAPDVEKAKLADELKNKTVVTETPKVTTVTTGAKVNLPTTPAGTSAGNAAVQNSKAATTTTAQANKKPAVVGAQGTAATNSKTATSKDANKKSGKDKDDCSIF